MYNYTFFFSRSTKNTILQAPVFLQDSDNSLHWKQQTLAHCLEKCACGLSQREPSECLTSCLPVYSGFTGLKDRRPWLKGTERERTKRGGEMENAGCLSRCIKLSSPQMHQNHTGCLGGERSFMWWENKAYRAAIILFVVCF